MYYIDSIEVDNGCHHESHPHPVYNKPFIPMPEPIAVTPLSNNMVAELIDVFKNSDDSAKPVLSYIDDRKHRHERYCEKYEKSRSNNLMRVIKFVYRYDDIYEEVYKRTSFLSKNRPSDTLSHQLSKMSFTRDEDFMFKPFIMEAAASIFERIYPFSKGIPDAFSFIPKTNTTIIEKAPDIVDVLEIDDIFDVTSTLIKHDDAIGSWYKLNGSTPVTKLKNIDNTKYGVRVTARFNYSVSENGTMIRKSEYCTLEISARRSTPVKWETTIFVPEGVYGEDIQKFEMGNSLEIVDALVIHLGKAAPIAKWTYVEYVSEDKVELFKAICNADTHDSVYNELLFEKIIVDDRDAVCFKANQLTWMDENALPITDNAIFEAIVTFVMSQWFMNVYPSEATLYYTKYVENLDKIRYRLNAQKTPVRRRYNLF